MEKFLDNIKNTQNIKYAFQTKGFYFEGDINPSNIIIYDDYIRIGDFQIDKNKTEIEYSEDEIDIFDGNSELTLVFV